MSKTRVYELADELGINKHEMVTKINGLGLGFVVNNYMQVLTIDEISSIKTAFEKKADEPKVDERLAPTVIRRRSKKKVEDDPAEDEIAAAAEAAEPEAEAEVAAEAEVEAAPAPAAPVKRRKKKSAEPEPVVEAEAAPESLPEPVAEVASEPSEPAEEEAAPVEAAETAAEAAPAAEEQPKTPETNQPKAPAPATDRRGVRQSRGAKVVGAISQNVLMDRLAAEGKDFSPGPKRRTDREQGGGRDAGRTKRVVEGRDLYDARSRRSKRRQQKTEKRTAKTEITVAAEHKRVIRIEDAITVGDLAHQMGAKSGQVAMKLLEMGMMATVNTMLDFDTTALIAEEFGYTVENVAFDIGKFYDTTPDEAEKMVPRPPVVTVMGHVDHGKTSLLDAIRSSTVASGEAGGITQHIGAYQVETSVGRITFLDTPGHEAFTALRARGAKATDIVVLVVAADDGVMPQTVEAINHSRAAGVPIIVAMNKIDKEGANPDRVKQALAEYELLPEDWGGSTLFVPVSALTGENVQTLVETIALQAEVEELNANPDRDAQGIVVEAELDIGRGPVATVLVQRGTLKRGDIIVSGMFYGRVRTMTDERGKERDAAGPSQPVEITGLGGVPEAGEPFFAVADERDAKRITNNVQDQRRKEEMAARAKESATSLEDLAAMVKLGELKELKVIVKGDVQGSVEALRDAFAKLGNEEVAVKTIHSAVGGITENDVNLAASADTGAVVVGFNVRPDGRAVEMAEKYGVQVVTYNVIYDAIEQIRSLLEGLLAPLIEENVTGRAEVRETFSAPKIGTIAGCYVLDGMLRRNSRARLLRDGRVIYETSIGSLRRFKDDVREVKGGFECGLSLDNYNDIKVGDVVEAYELEEVAATLE